MGAFLSFPAAILGLTKKCIGTIPAWFQLIQSLQVKLVNCAKSKDPSAQHPMTVDTLLIPIAYYWDQSEADMFLLQYFENMSNSILESKLQHMIPRLIP
jgi:hypothetical protein